MKQEELKKPEDYVAGGAEKLTNFMGDNITQVTFLILLLIWTVSALWTTVYDIFSGNFDHKVLSYTFIIGIVIAGYLQTKIVLQKKGKPKVEPSKGGCTSCGKKKSGIKISKR